MPIYEYRCEGCGEKIEKLVKGMHREPPVISCRVCGARMERKMGNVVYFEFKGGV